MHDLPDFTVGGAIRQTVDILKQHGGQLLALAVLLYALPVAIITALPLLGLVPNTATMQASMRAGEAPEMSSAVTLMVYGFASMIVVFVGSLLASAAEIWVAHEGLHGHPAAIGGATARSARVLFPGLGMSILYGFGVGLASILLLVPGIMLLVRWIVALPAVVIEREGVLGSLRRSRDLTDGHRWPILGFMLLLFLFSAVVFLVTRFGGAALAAAVGGSGGSTLAVVVGLVANAIASAVGGSATAALYFELRRASEGVLSLETAAAFL